MADPVDPAAGQPWEGADPWHEGTYPFEDRLDTGQLRALRQWQATARHDDLVDQMIELRNAVPTLDPMGEITNEQSSALTPDQQVQLGVWREHHAIWMADRVSPHHELPPLPTDDELAGLTAAANDLAEQVASTAQMASPTLDLDAASDLIDHLLTVETHLDGLTDGLAGATAIREALHVQLVYTSLITEANLAYATDAAGLQKALITFASMLVDLASVADFLENLDEFDGDTFVKKLDSAYEFMKDFESACNTLSEMFDLPGSTIVNDLMGLQPAADDWWGNDPRAEIGTLKSHASDIIGILDDLRDGKQISGRTTGQLIVRICKSIAEAQLAEREAVIGQLQQDLAAEQGVLGGVSDEKGVLAERRHAAIEARGAVRSARTGLEELVTRFDPAVGVSNAAAAGPTFATPRETVAHYSTFVTGDADAIRSGTGNLAIGQKPDTGDCADCGPEQTRFRDAQQLLERLEREHLANPKQQRVLDGARADRDRYRDELTLCQRMLCPSQAPADAAASDSTADLNYWMAAVAHEPVVAKCEACQHIADEIGRVRATIVATQHELDGLERTQQEIERLRQRREHLADKQADIAELRAGALDLGSEALRGRFGEKIATEWLEEYNKVTGEIGEVNTAIAELAEQTAKIPTLEARISRLRDTIRQLRDLLRRCEETRCRDDDDLRDDEFAAAAALLSGDEATRRLASDRAAADRAASKRKKLIGAALGAGAVALAVVLIAVFAGGGDDGDPTPSGPASPADPAEPATPTDDGDPEPPATNSFAGSPVIGDLDPASVQTTPDGTDDSIFSIRIEQVTETRPGTDITESGAGVADADADAARDYFNKSSFPCGTDDDDLVVTCQRGAGPIGDGRWLVVSIRVDGGIAPGSIAYEYGLAVDSDGDTSDNYSPVEPFDWDFFSGTEHFFRLAVDLDGKRRFWSDRVIDGIPTPIYTAGVAIEHGDTITFVVPMSELEGDDIAYRVSSFANETGPFEPPHPTTSNGDVNGADPTEPLIVVDVAPSALGLDTATWPDLPTVIERTDPPDGNLENQWIRAEVAVVEERLREALATDDPSGAVLATLHPAVTGTLGEDVCLATIDATLGQADEVILDGEPTAAEPLGPFPAYSIEGSIVYPTGTVDARLRIAPGANGEWYMLLNC